MEPIIWSENFNVGVPLFDEQHKRLITMINKVIKDSAATVGSETVSDILTDLTRYVQEHFKSEENLMIEHGYPHLEQHKSQHKAYKKKVAELCIATMDDFETVPQDLIELLQQWWTRHILHVDMEYKPFFEEKGVW